MRTPTVKRISTVLTLVGFVVLLNACHTIAGLGEDISHVGKKIEKTADKHS